MSATQHAPARRTPTAVRDEAAQIADACEEDELAAVFAEVDRRREEAARERAKPDPLTERH